MEDASAPDCSISGALGARHVRCHLSGMTDAIRPPAHPPETTEGWYVFHQVLRYVRPAVRALASDALRDAERALESLAAPECGGWSAVVPLIG